MFTHFFQSSFCYLHQLQIKNRKTIINTLPPSLLKFIDLGNKIKYFYSINCNSLFCSLRVQLLLSKPWWFCQSMFHHFLYFLLHQQYFQIPLINSERKSYFIWINRTCGENMWYGKKNLDWPLFLLYYQIVSLRSYDSQRSITEGHIDWKFLWWVKFKLK